MLVTVGKVERCELLSQFLLRVGNDVQCCVEFSVTRALKQTCKRIKPYVSTASAPSSGNRLHFSISLGGSSTHLLHQFVADGIDIGLDDFLTLCSVLLVKGEVETQQVMQGAMISHICFIYWT